jgi:predicted TIM-barrel fold metal-dependent hydrolase
MSMVVDCHVHVKGGDVYRREFPPERIIQTMDEAGIDQSVIFSICLPTPEANELTRRAAARYPDRLIPFAHVNPDDGALWPVWLEQAIHEFGFRGLKVHFGVLAEVNAKVIEPVVAKTQELRIPLLVDCMQHLDVMDELTARYTDVSFIIAHLGAPSNEKLNDRFIALARERPNVYLDTSFSSCPWKIGDAIRWAGSKKVLFGSDGPLIHPSIELAKIEVCRLPSAEREDVLAGNILRLLSPGGAGQA